MGWLDDRRERKAAEEAAKAAQQVAQARLALRDEIDNLNAYLDSALSWRGEDVGGFAGGVVVKPGERVFLIAEGAALIEPRRLPGHYEGGSSGVSFRIAKGVSYRVGQSRGTYVQGAEVPTPIDNGTVVITDKRVVFSGMKATREWAFTKLVGYTHVDEGADWTAIQVSNRQRVSGVMYGDDASRDFRFRFGLALAVFQGTETAFADGIRADVQAAQAELAALGGGTDPAALPAARTVTPPPPPLPPAGWYDDPDGSGHMRWWDGTAWTADFMG